LVIVWARYAMVEPDVALGGCWSALGTGRAGTLIHWVLNAVGREMNHRLVPKW